MSDVVQYEFTPIGVVRAGETVPVTGDAVMPAGAALAASRPDVPQSTRPFVPSQVASGQAISPKDVIRLAKARVKEIKAELKNKRALERELARLENLLNAAKKPLHLAEVRQLASRK